MLGLGARAEDGVLHLDEIPDLGARADDRPRPEPRERSDLGFVLDPAPLEDRRAQDADAVADPAACDVDVGIDPAVPADARRALDDDRGIDDGPGAQLRLPVDPGAAGVEERHAPPGEAAVLALAQEPRRPGQVGPPADAEGLLRGRILGQPDPASPGGEEGGERAQPRPAPGPRGRREDGAEVGGGDDGDRIPLEVRAATHERQREAVPAAGRDEPLQGLRTDEGPVGRDEDEVGALPATQVRPGSEQGPADASRRLSAPRSGADDGKRDPSARKAGRGLLADVPVEGQDDAPGAQAGGGVHEEGGQGPAEERRQGLLPRRGEARSPAPPVDEDDGLPAHASLAMSLNFLSSQSDSKSGSFWASVANVLSFWMAFFR